MNDDDDNESINLESKQVKTISYIIDENEEDDILEIEHNISKIEEIESNNLEKYENISMLINDININNIYINESVELNTLEDLILESDTNLNTQVSLTNLENCIKLIDKSDYIIDDESDEIKYEKEIEKSKNSNLNNLYLTKKNLIKINSVKSNIQIYGCSHCRCFYREDFEIDNIHIYNNFKSAASISGIINDISSLNYKSFINKKIIDNPFDFHVFKLGQIDVEYIYYYKILKNIKISKENFYKDITCKFIKYLKLFISKYGTKLIICGSNLSNPINWEDNIKKVLGINYLPDNISYNSSNHDIILFNSILKKECELNNIIYFDLTKKCCFKKKNNYFIKEKYIGKDYHYKGAESPDVFNLENKNYGLFTYSIFLNILVQNL